MRPTNLHRSSSGRSRLDPSTGAALGGLAALGLSIALVPLRGVLANTSIALVLVLPVLLGAFTGGSRGGAMSAVCATLGFDFFHTRPYNSLSIGSADDVETAVLLLLVGLIVGAVAARAHRSADTAQQGRDEVRHLHRMAELVANATPSAEVLAAAQRSLRELLVLSSCEFSTDAPADVPFGTVAPGTAALGRAGDVALRPRRLGPRGFTWPAEGVDLDVIGHGHTFGRLHLVPAHPSQGVTIEESMAAVAIADQLGAAFAAERHKATFAAERPGATVAAERDVTPAAERHSQKEMPS